MIFKLSAPTKNIFTPNSSGLSIVTGYLGCEYMTPHDYTIGKIEIIMNFQQQIINKNIFVSFSLSHK